MELLRLRGRKVCDALLRKGSVWKGTHLWIRWMKGTPRHPSASAQPAFYIGTLASARLDKSAVKRNRMRRRGREAFRLVHKELQSTLPSVQLLLLPRSSSLTADFTDLQADVRRFLTFLTR